MSAFLIPLLQLPTAEVITGQPSFSVPCRSESVEYMGCNWENCPPEIVDALEHLPGVVVAETWDEALEAAGATVVKPENTMGGLV